MTVKLPSLNSLAGGVLALISAAVLTSCGGGGASGNPSQPGSPDFSVLPGETTIYAGVPATFTLVGGTGPFLLNASEPNVLPVPDKVDGRSFTVVAANPGVVDPGLQPGALPIRTVNLVVRSGNGLSSTSVVHVGQNFLTGYGATFTPSACPGSAQIPTSTTAGDVACSGGDTAVRFAATTNGTLHGDELFNLKILRGAAVLVDPSTGANGDTISVRSDHTGTVTAIIRATANQPTQLGVLRIQEASTGVYMDTVFVIVGGSASATIEALPDKFTFTGATTADCGTGSGTVQVFGGVPPYTASSSNTSLVNVSPTTSGSQPGVFTVTAGNAGLCGDVTVVFTDSLGAHTSITVTTEAGKATPVTPIQISPNPVTVGCAQTVSASIAGGTSGSGGGGGGFSASTTDTNLTIAVSGSTISVTRAGPAGPGTGTKASTVTITDGTSFASLTVNNPATCP